MVVISFAAPHPSLRAHFRRATRWTGTTPWPRRAATQLPGTRERSFLKFRLLVPGRLPGARPDALVDPRRRRPTLRVQPEPDLADEIRTILVLGDQADQPFDRNIVRNRRGLGISVEHPRRRGQHPIGGDELQRRFRPHLQRMRLGWWHGCLLHRCRQHRLAEHTRVKINERFRMLLPCPR